MQIEFIEPASIELDDAIEYYELQLTGLGRRFFNEVIETIDLIIQFPQLWAQNSENTRKAVLRKFPYNLVYSILDNKIYIKIDSSDNITTTGFTSPTIFINGIKEGGSLTTIITNEWYHICVITSTGLDSINGQTFIGYDIPANSGTTSTKYFKGQMSDFRIYDCSLVNSEIQKIYQNSNI